MGHGNHMSAPCLHLDGLVNDLDTPIFFELPPHHHNHRVVSRSAGQKQEVYYPRVSAEAEDVRYTIRGFRLLIKNDFEV